MSLKKKIILSFLVSFSIIIILGISAYVEFIEIGKEIRYLELADSIRSKSLQLRRHEKNFLYGDFKEADNVYSYLNQLKDLVKQGNTSRRVDSALQELDKKLDEYRNSFDRLNKITSGFHAALKDMRNLKSPYAFILPFVESTFLEHPLQDAELLKKTSIASGDKMITVLQTLAAETNSLRRLGEDILVISKDLDRSARDRVETLIRISQRMALILIPASFFIGLVLLFVISQRVVNRLRMLMETIEKTGKGYFSPLPVPVQHDEVNTLIRTFNRMEEDLMYREEELKRKEEELLQSRKLAALGTLASGVAHELNNPLNNIYLAAQTLFKEMDREGCPEIIRDSISDIYSQSLRVKKIVSDLLEFARGKKPEFRQVNIREVIDEVFNSLLSSMGFGRIKLSIEGEGVVSADKEQMEQVFINLFSNAIEAMSGEGTLDVEIIPGDQIITVKVSDSGSGMSEDTANRIFEPFFTTKEKGTGLGLSIVYNIIKKHKGEINVESEEGKGTTFTLALPRKNVVAGVNSGEATSKQVE